MSQNLERFGVEAVWLDAKFEKGVRDYNSAMRKADSETKKATASMSSSFEDNQKAIDSWLSDFKRAEGITSQQSRRAAQTTTTANKKIEASFVSVAAQITAFAFTAQKAYQQYQQAAQEAAQRASLQALAASYGTDGGKIVSELIKISDQTLTTAEAVSIANSALLAGGASFASEVPRLFEIARSAAVATGQDVNFVFDTLIRGIAKGSPLLIDNAEIYLSLGDAVEQYADDLGKTTDELTRQERTQATLNAVLAQGQTIVDGVGASALDTTEDVSQLNTAFKSVGEVARAGLRAIGESGDGINIFGRQFDGVTDIITQGLNSIIQLIPLASAGFASLFELITSFGVDDIAEIITGQTTISEIFDRASQRGVEAFTLTAEALGIFTDDTQEAVAVVEELGDVTEQTTGDLDKFNEAISSARTQAIEAFIQRAIQAERQLEDAAIKRARKIEDIERSAARRRAQIEEQFTQTIENLQAQAAENRRKRQIDLARQLEQIERNFQERKRAIQQQFAVSFQRAVRSRDALALVEAIRTRNRDLEEAKRQRDTERAEATTNAAQQEEEQKRSLERQIEAARQARAQQIADAQAAQAQQLDDLRRAELQQAEDRARANARWLEDQERAFMDRRVRAEAQYRNDEAIYQRHLQRMLQLTNTFIPSIFRSPTGTAGTMQNLPIGLAEGGAFIASGATPFVAGEAGPELVIAQPLSQIAATNPVSPQIGGQMRHEVSGAVQASMAGFQGRLTAAVNDAVLRAFREVLR